MTKISLSEKFPAPQCPIFESGVLTLAEQHLVAAAQQQMDIAGDLVTLGLGFVTGFSRDAHTGAHPLILDYIADLVICRTSG
ncbi:hypothetical protein IU487_29700 [Nocardia puris]|nr:hypothetical protein [Nocardia puris]